MKYILKAVSLRHKEDEDPYYGLDPQYIPEGARIELVETRWFGEKKAKIKQWVIDISTVEELHELAKWDLMSQKQSYHLKLRMMSWDIPTPLAS